PGVPLAWENLTLDHFITAVTTQSALTGVANSVMLAGLAALACGALGLGIGVVMARTGSRAARGLGAVAMAPQAVPGIVIAVAWLVLA
ncbi:hypothetical protein MRO49_25320, partial [Escherichia coli]|nr:hypothetical protein [Escherichia coli]